MLFISCSDSENWDCPSVNSGTERIGTSGLDPSDFHTTVFTLQDGKHDVNLFFVKRASRGADRREIEMYLSSIGGFDECFPFDNQNEVKILFVDATNTDMLASMSGCNTLSIDFNSNQVTQFLLNKSIASIEVFNRNTETRARFFVSANQSAEISEFARCVENL